MKYLKKFLFCMLLPFCVTAGQVPSTPDQITYDWLIGEGAQEQNTDHVRLIKKIFQITKVKTVLEYGLGYGTKFLLENCNKVISIDIITHGYGPETMRHFLGLYHEFSNWIPIAFFSGYLGNDYSWAPYKHLGSEALYKATSYQNLHHKNYAKIDDFYITEFNAFTKNLLRYNKADLAFVGYATKIRGDVVQILFDKVSIIVAHNTLARETGIVEDDWYGYIRVNTPEDYEEIFFNLNGGTTAWIKKKPETVTLIETLKKFSEELK